MALQGSKLSLEVYQILAILPLCLFKPVLAVLALKASLRHIKADAFVFLD